MAKKEETKQLLAKKAEELFASNKDLTKVHLCVNGQGFTDKAYAERYAKQFDDDSVYSFSKESEALEHSGKVVAIDVKGIDAQEESARKQAEAEAKAREEKAKKEAEAKRQATLSLASKQEAMDYENVHKDLLEDRPFLMARYEELKGKKAPSNIKDETLIEKVKALEVERFEVVKK